MGRVAKYDCIIGSECDIICSGLGGWLGCCWEIAGACFLLTIITCCVSSKCCWSLLRAIAYDSCGIIYELIVCVWFMIALCSSSSSLFPAPSFSLLTSTLDTRPISSDILAMTCLLSILVMLLRP